VSINVNKGKSPGLAFALIGVKRNWLLAGARFGNVKGKRGPNQTKPNQTKPNQTKPNQTIV